MEVEPLPSSAFPTCSSFVSTPNDGSWTSLTTGTKIHPQPPDHVVGSFFVSSVWTARPREMYELEGRGLPADIILSHYPTLKVIK